MILNHIRARESDEAVSLCVCECWKRMDFN